MKSPLIVSVQMDINANTSNETASKYGFEDSPNFRADMTYYMQEI